MSYVLKKTNSNYDSYAEDIRKRIVPRDNTITVEEALAHKVETKSSQEASLKLRRFLYMKLRVNYPSKLALRKEKQKRIVFPRNFDDYSVIKGQLVPRTVWLDYLKSLRKSVHQLYKLGVINITTKVIEIDIKDGLDGAGNQMDIGNQKWTQMVTFGYVILKVRDTTDGKNEILFENEYPNSNFSFKPLCLTLQKETYDLCTKLFIKYPKEQPKTIVKIGDHEINVVFNIKRCMVDGKLRNICSGRQSAHCNLCDFTLDDYYNKNKGNAVMEHKIKYDLTDDHDQSEDLYFRMVREGLIGCKDAKRRYNFTEQPIKGIDGMTVLHTRINTCRTVFESLVTHACCDLKTLDPSRKMSSKNKELKDKGIKKYSKRLRQKASIVVKDVGKGNTGGGLVGNHAKKFFENGSEVVDLILPNSPYNAPFKVVIKNLHVLTCLFNSNLPINVKAYQEKCRRTIGFIQNKLPLFRFTETVHMLLFHSWEFIQLNGGRGLCQLGEDAIEMVMGRGRKARQHQAFLGSVKRNLDDALQVLELESDYSLNKDFKKLKRSQVCYHL